MDPKGATIIVGFDDGVVRVLNFSKKEADKKTKETSVLTLAQALKPHIGKVTSLALDSRGELLATGVCI